MIVTARAKASSRTKNRIREHGPEFTHRRGPSVPRFSGNRGVEWILLTSEDGWFGWLPVDEINTED